MKKKTMTQTFVALAAAGFITAAVAGGEAEFSKLDADADGYISAEESLNDEALYKGWSDVDANSDGKVDPAEFSAFETGGSESAAPEAAPSTRTIQ
jgi:Ca2+-binding EF-hand superfamily protein